MLAPSHMRAMRVELSKVAATSTQGPTPHEDMSKARFKQTLKDMPIVVGGSALGYGLGKTIGDYAATKLLESEAGRAGARNYAPMIGAILAAAGSYGLGVQRSLMLERRNKAHELEEHAKLKRAGAAPNSTYQATPSPQFAREADRSVLANEAGRVSRSPNRRRGPGDITY